ncbi:MULTISPECIES: hypothetical protein [Methylobacterium]|uniref:hypothetical protein n=1 Tax=Methylobacterium TaxID=407 RepID=UPI0013ECEC5A|nr:hypothetical protein [Methylobacterium sp. DB0501]NGM35006.1 hypothetical protein [Methylobacterium sp. DB0501]
MIRHRPTRTASVRTARRRKAIRQKPRSAAAPKRSRPEDEIPIPPVTTEELEPFDVDDLRALRSGWHFVE